MADNAEARLPDSAENDETHANSSAGSPKPSELVTGQLGDEDVTVLTTLAALEAEEFPQGLSPRELSLTLTGQLLDHFHLQEYIGGGGMGAVFKALDTTLDRIVAVKVVASQSISSEDLQRRFLIEAQSTARLDHPNIARIHFVGRDRGLPYIVFEYIDGVNVRDLVLNHGKLLLGDALSYTCQIAHALAHAREKNVVHRDIKPSNILITREGQAKLVDMGLARFCQVGKAQEDLTSTGVTLGTFDYISPEQARDPREADTRSDIYSLGCTLFYMLAGRPPFAEGTAVQKLLMHQDQTPPSLSALQPEIPEAVSQLVQRMLEKSPDQRPQTPYELVNLCYDLFHTLGLQPPQALPPLPLAPQIESTKHWQTHLPWAIPLIVFFFLSAVWWARNEDSGGNFDFPPARKLLPLEDRGTFSEASGFDKQGSETTNPDDLSAEATSNLGEPVQLATPEQNSQRQPGEFPLDSLLDIADRAVEPSNASLPSTQSPSEVSETAKSLLELEAGLEIEEETEGE